MGADDDLALPAIVVAEYLEGVLLTVDEARRATHREFLGALSRALPVIDYDTEVAEHHPVLLAHTRRGGRPRGAHDLIIAATARVSGRTILTGECPGPVRRAPRRAGLPCRRGIEACLVSCLSTLRGIQAALAAEFGEPWLEEAQ